MVRRSIFDEIFDELRNTERLLRSLMLMDEFDREHFTTADAGVEFYEDDNFYEVLIELPGFEKDEIKVRIVGDTLHVEAKKKRDTEFSRYIKNIEKTIRLPGKVDPKHVKAKYKNGILIIRLPKTEETKGVTIKVE